MQLKSLVLGVRCFRFLFSMFFLYFHLSFTLPYFFHIFTLVFDRRVAKGQVSFTPEHAFCCLLLGLLRLYGFIVECMCGRKRRRKSLNWD